MEKEKRTKIEIEELKREKAESELKFLKTQINPHFLFNALNNIYTMTYIGDKSAHEKIATLSDMLRYVLYDCESDLIPLDKEVKYISSYIEFQQLKTERKQNITFLYNKENENYMISPMLLIPFIENGFKHSGIEKDRSGFVSILLSQTKEKLLFTVKNSHSGEKMPVKPPKDRGIGIENVINRLELLYPGKYLLDVRADNHEYSIYLELFSNEFKREI
jgi:LytS/YehU family sensor histidine kinase